MEVSQISRKDLIPFTEKKKQLKKNSNHSKEYWHLYNQKRKDYLLEKQKKYRAKLKANQPDKPLSNFQQIKTKQFLKLLVNQRSFVPVPQKLKHPVIKNWNADNYWYHKQIDHDNLERGCVRIIPDNWNNCYIGWLDIDCKKWTKIAKKYHCGYVNSPKGHIRIPFLFRSKNQEKTGSLYYQGKKIGDAKISGEVMLPNMAYYDKNGQQLGYYRYKAWGTFFPLQNKIFANPTEFWNLLKQDFNIEYLSISQHLNQLKETKKARILEIPNCLENLTIPVPEPPWQKLIIHQAINSQNRH